MESMFNHLPDPERDQTDLSKLAGPPSSPRPAENLSASAIRIKAAADVTADDIQALIRGETSALVVRNFIDPEAGRTIAQALLQSGQRSKYANLQDDLEKIGSTLFENVSGEQRDAQKITRYLDAAEKNRDVIEAACAPAQVSPMKQAEEFLGKVVGAQRLELLGRPAFAGLVRIITDGRQILPHQDDLGEDLPDLNFAERLRDPGSGQLAVNVYLQAAQSGGELRLWLEKFDSSRCAAMRASGSDYGADAERLPPSAATYIPQSGDLVIFNSTKMHSVGKVDGGPRVSISFFLGVTRDGEARIWS